MRDGIMAIALASLMALAGAVPIAAQEGTPEEWMTKQFYGNRIKGGSVLLSGTFQRTGFQSDNLTGVTSNVGLGVGLGLSENFALSGSFIWEDLNDSPSNSNFDYTANTFQVGLRYLPNTFGGFVQLYTGLDFFRRAEELKPFPPSGPSEIDELVIIGLNAPLGCTFWISTFMAINIELVSVSVAKNIDDNEGKSGILNMDLSLTNPTFGVTFLVNGKKP